MPLFGAALLLICLFQEMGAEVREAATFPFSQLLKVVY